MNIELNYPVFVLPRNNNMMYVYTKDKDWKSTSEELLKTLDYNNLDVIDSSGCMYKINKAFKVKYLGLLGFNPLLRGRQVLIDFEYDSNVEQLSLKDFKRKVIKRIMENKRFWESGWDIEDLEQRLENSDNFYSIADLLK